MCSSDLLQVQEGRVAPVSISVCCWCETVSGSKVPPADMAHYVSLFLHPASISRSNLLQSDGSFCPCRLISEAGAPSHRSPIASYTRREWPHSFQIQHLWLRSCSTQLGTPRNCLHQATDYVFSPRNQDLSGTGYASPHGIDGRPREPAVHSPSPLLTTQCSTTVPPHRRIPSKPGPRSRHGVREASFAKEGGSAIRA